MRIPSTQHLLELCIEAAKTAGTHALHNLHRREETVATFDHDMKLVMDQECQAVAEEVIHASYPDHAILGEEGLTEKADTYEWVIDPIDGTANYTRNVPLWCCSIAVRLDGTVLAGCVYVPVLDECYSASIDSSALCNGEPIRASNVPTLGKATFFTGLSKDVNPNTLTFFSDIAPRVCKLRIIGCAAMDICHVACGRSDGFYESDIYLWDVAAAGLIAERAGASITIWDREEPNGLRYLCTAPSIHEELKQTAEKHFGE